MIDQLRQLVLGHCGPNVLHDQVIATTQTPLKDFLRLDLFCLLSHFQVLGTELMNMSFETIV